MTCHSYKHQFDLNILKYCNYGIVREKTKQNTEHTPPKEMRAIHLEESIMVMRVAVQHKGKCVCLDNLLPLNYY